MIETADLTLRPHRADDLDALTQILSDPTTMSFWPRPYTREETAARIDQALKSYAEHGFGRYAVVLRETGQMVGSSGIVRMPVDGTLYNDLGYIIHHSFWRRGFATQAALALRDHAFGALGLSDLEANMPLDHHGSRRVAEHIGMRLVRTFRNAVNRDKETYLYELSKPD